MCPNQTIPACESCDLMTGNNERHAQVKHGLLPGRSFQIRSVILERLAASR